MNMRSTGLILAVVLGTSQLLPLNVAIAQRAQTAPADGSVLPFPPVPSASIAAPRLQDSRHQRRAEPSHLSKDAPNVLIILMDDVGFGQASTFGGEINTPTLSRLADQGISYNTFHTTSICSPTRAALLTGRNHQRVGNGTIAERAVDWDGYTGVIPKTSATMAEVLRDYGYKTAAIGKWHNTPADQTTSMGPFDRWPTGHGFDYFYGFLAGETSQWEPRLVENTNQIEPPHDEKYHLTEDLAQRGIDWLRHHQAFAPDKPFFLYWAPGAGHGRTKSSRNGPTSTRASSTTAGMLTASASSHARSRWDGSQPIPNSRRVPNQCPAGTAFRRRNARSSAG
jgi:arylsulfatase A-like enzyme